MRLRRPRKAAIGTALILLGLLAFALSRIDSGDAPGSRGKIGVPDGSPEPTSTALPSPGDGAPAAPGMATGSLYPVVRVVDGDTLWIRRGSDEEKIRLIGIDTPEVDWYGGQAECFGARAGRYVRDLLNGKDIALKLDEQRLDRYGRTLAYVYLEDGRMLNLLLVRGGFAEVTIVPPNERYANDLLAAESTARAADRGLWSAC